MTAPPALTSRPLSALPGVRHGFFGRSGGVSGGIYASLNCGPGSQDAPGDVEENRRRVAEALNVAPDHLLSAYQVHSAEAVVVTGPWNADPKTGREADERPRVDALVTQTPGVALSALAADCAPVLLADAQARVIGAAHAGWKGALTGVTDAALDAMERLGAKRERIVVAIGPCIGPRAYEVGPEYEARFLDADPANARFFALTVGEDDRDGDRRLFDLKAYVTARLIGAGVATVDTRPDCTYTQGDTWFSHRRAVHQGETDFGRNISVIVLDE